MSRIKIYEPFEVKRSNLPPAFTLQQRQKYFHLPDELWKELPRFRKSLTQVGFLLQWGYFRYSGHFYAAQSFHLADMEFVSQQVGIRVNPQTMKTYSTQLAGIHQKQILKLLGWKSFPEGQTAFANHVRYLVEIPLMPRKVLEKSRQWLRDQQIEVPGYDTFRRTISAAFNCYNQQNTRLLEQYLTPESQEAIDRILLVNPDNSSLLDTFKRPSQSERPQKIKDALNHFKTLKAYFEQVEPLVRRLNFNDTAISYYAYRTLKLRNNQTRLGKERYLSVVCFLAHQYRVWQDTFVEILLSSVKNAGNGVERIRQQQLYQTDFQRKAATRLVINTRNNYRKQVEEAIAILKDTHVEDKDKIEAALQILERQGVLNQEQNHLIDGLDREVNRDEQQESWLIIGQQYQRTNNRIGGILRVLSFNRSLSDTRLLEAIEHFNGRCGRIRQPAKDISWLSAAQQAALYNEAGEFDKNLYRMLLFEHVYDAIRGATLVLNHSYKYRHLEEYLLDKAYFGQHREQLLKESGLSHLSHFGQVMEKLKTDLDGQYKATNERFLTGHNAYLSFNESGEAQIKTPPLEKPVFAREIDPYFSGAGYVAINELLAQVENATHYLSQLEHLGGKHTKKRPSPETFFAALVGIGCNIRIEKMAAISKGINPSTLRLVSELYLNPESLKAANDHLIAFKNKLALPEFHRKNPDQLHTASDGQKFLVGEDSLNADYSYKYPGYDKALSVNTAIDERFSIFHSTVISASEKEAPYLVDIHLNNPAVKSTIHSTDTGGYTEAIFGITNMLSVFYAPRIKGLSSQQLFGFGFRSDYKAKKYPLLPDSSINTKVIEQNWEDILRLMVTLKSGKTTAYQIFKRLSSYARQNPLLKAIKEYGKIIKSGFILKYYDELALRQAIEKQLSRIEMVNRFSKAVFFGNNQEFSVGLKEEQEKVVLARRLIQNAIIVWNYLYLSELIGQLSSQKEIEDLLTAVKEGTIVHWAHVNFHGEYDFTDLSKSQVPRFNLETILNLKLEQVA